MRKMVILVYILVSSIAVFQACKEKPPEIWYDTRNFYKRPVINRVIPQSVLIFYVDTLPHLSINSSNGKGEVYYDNDVHWLPGYYMTGEKNPLYDTTFTHLPANLHIFYIMERSKNLK